MLPQFGQAIAGLVTNHERAADPRLQFDQSPMNSGLAGAEHLGSGQRAAGPCYGQEISQVVPVEQSQLSNFANLVRNLVAAQKRHGGAILDRFRLPFSLHDATEGHTKP